MSEPIEGQVSWHELCTTDREAVRTRSERQVRKSETGHVGSLHAKCAVADSRQVLMTSANLTDYAFNLNIELGLLVTGGSIPEAGRRQFRELIRTGTLKKAR